MSCTTTTTTTCYPCDADITCDCPHGTADAQCVQYTGDDLDNIGVHNGDYLETILQTLNDVVFSEVDFDANSTDSIEGVSGGSHGHSPMYNVILDPTDSNALTITSLGLYANSDNIGDGKVKVDSSDTKDYLINQLLPGNDANNIITITPTNISGVIYMVPIIDIVAFLNYIKDNFSDLLCSLVTDCMPVTTTTTSTSTSSTTSTTSTSSTTTTTTTAAPNTFQINNDSNATGAFTIYLTDETSLINYVIDNTTFTGQSAYYTYSGTTNGSKITVQHSPTITVRVEVLVNSVSFYDSVDSVGSDTISAIPPQTDIVINIYQDPATTTTTTTTSTSTTSTTSTTTTTTSSTTTTTTTLTGTGIVNVDNTCDAGAPSPTINDVRIDGVSLADATFPVTVGGGNSTQGNAIINNSATIDIDVSADDLFVVNTIRVTDSNSVDHDQTVTGSATYTFTGIVFDAFTGLTVTLLYV